MELGGLNKDMINLPRTFFSRNKTTIFTDGIIQDRGTEIHY